MRSALLIRVEQSDEGTFGVLHTEGFTCHTVELPWRENQRRVSCVPKGEYPVQLILSPRFGYSYWIHPISGRSEVLIHGGAWAGDTTKGWRTHSAGCILLGDKRGVAQEQMCILLSQPPLQRLLKVMNKEPFQLTIEENF